MAGDTTITVIGNLTDDPELRFTPSGAAVAKFRVASTPRFLDRASGEWKDGEPLFLSCTVWRYATAKVQKMSRSSGNGGFGASGGGGGYSADDPWASAAPAGGGGKGSDGPGSHFDDEPPF